MKVLIACEFSGRVRDAFIRKGHDAISCDILPSESAGPHYQGNILRLLSMPKTTPFDLMIAHPPCTRLCNSGVMWLKKRNLWHDMRRGAEFFKTLMDANIPKIAIENPIMHKYAVEIIGRRQDQIIQPWQFGHGETKATCLWLKGLPKLKPTNIVDGREQRLHKLPPSKDRAKLRSLTFQGIADAMADQWGKDKL
jgi:hypothetical protein